ncbi:MAG: RHS repeat-associated core domain-containing protein [archaeon]
MKREATILGLTLVFLFLLSACDMAGEASYVATAPQSGVDGSDTRATVSTEEHYVYGAGLEAKYSEDGLRYIHQDVLGSTRAVTDEAGSLVESNTHLPYGQMLGASSERLGFTGKEDDGDLAYYGARYYDPDTGRFTQKDPIASGRNWFAYTSNNPLNRVDPSGMTDFSIDPEQYWNSAGADMTSARSSPSLMSYFTDSTDPRQLIDRCIFNQLPQAAWGNQQMMTHHIVRMPQDLEDSFFPPSAVTLFSDIQIKYRGDVNLFMFLIGDSNWEGMFIHEIGHAFDYLASNSGAEDEVKYLQSLRLRLWGAETPRYSKEEVEIMLNHREQLASLGNFIKDFYALSAQHRNEPSSYLTTHPLNGRYGGMPLDMEDFAETFRIVMTQSPEEIDSIVGNNEVLQEKVGMMQQIIGLGFVAKE